MDLHIHITPDRLQAILDLPTGKFVDLAVLKVLLQKGGILHGLHRDALIAATQPADHDRALILAHGQAPVAASAGDLEPAIDWSTLPRAVEAGERLGRFLPPVPAAPGMGVDAKPIDAPEAAKVITLAIGRGLEVGADGTVTTTRDGQLVRDPDGTLRVAIPDLIERERSDVLVQMDQKAMEAWIELNPGEYCGSEAMQIALNRNGIAFGISIEALADAGRPEREARTLVMARGTPAENGHNAEIEMLVDDTRHYQADEYDRIDFHDLGRIPEMKPGDPIARQRPATPGKPGMNVRGQVVKQKPGVDIDLAQYAGDGTRVSPADKLLLIADTQGVFRRNRNGKFMVQPLLIVEGDVDFKVGNIDTTLPVMIKGDIKKGFSVKTTSDLTVMGVIEDARVSAQGNITVSGGILPGEKRVKAHGDLVARYISGREVKARNITATTAITASRLLATGDIGAKELIAGWSRCAGNVVCDLLGNEGGQKTLVEVGTNPFEEALFEGAQRELKRLEGLLPSMKDHCKVVAHKLDKAEPGSEEHVDVSEELRQAVKAYSDACTRFAECEGIIKRHGDNAELALKAGLGARITVRKMAHVGVELRIAGLAHLDVWEPLRNVNFHYKEGNVSW